MERIEQIRISISTGNSAFEEMGTEKEIARILRTIADKIENGNTPQKPMDINGQSVGIIEYQYEEKPSVKHFKDFIKSNEGFILSDGTLNLTHLLSKAHDLIVAYNMNDSLQIDIIDLFDLDCPLEKGETLYSKQYHGEAKIYEDSEQDANEIWNDDVYNYFNEISPNGYSFGSFDGDGACIGWFKVEEEN